MAKRKRLDTILLEKGLITEEQVRQTLERQSAQGGKFGSHLLFQEFLTEGQLVDALSVQYNCPGVTLTGKKISPRALKIIPYRIAVSRKLIPFNYSRVSKRVDIAVADPDQPKLADELSYLLGDHEARLFVASEGAIFEAIKTGYGSDPSLVDVTAAHASDIDDTDQNSASHSNDDTQEDDSSQRSNTGVDARIMIVSSDKDGAERLKQLVESNGPHVRIVARVDDAVKALQRRFVETVYVHDTTKQNRRAVEDRIRKFNFRTEVHWFSDWSSLALGEASKPTGNKLKTAELLVTLLNAAGGLDDNRPRSLASFAERVCTKLHLPPGDTERIVTSALLHNLYRYDSPSANGQISRSRLFARTAALLESIGFDDDTVEILRAVYRDRHQELSEERAMVSTTIRLGGDIIALADLYCDERNPDEPLSLSDFEEIRDRFVDFDGSVYMPEVIDAFLMVLQEECLHQELTDPRGEVAFLLPASNPGIALMSYHLAGEGIRVIYADNAEDLAQLCARRRPDAITVGLPPQYDNPVDFVHSLKETGVDLTQSPGILLAEGDFERWVDELFDLGIHDVVSATANRELLSARLIMMVDRRRRVSGRNSESEAVARGQLANINLIDLIQALGPGQKTVKITLNQDERELITYLKSGQLVYAMLEETEGPEAIFEGVCWNNGSFTVQVAELDGIPNPNINMPNESILMEGCRLLDERIREAR